MSTYSTFLCTSRMRSAERASERAWAGSAVRAGRALGFETRPRGRHGSSPAHLNFPQFDGPEPTSSKLIWTWIIAFIRARYRFGKRSGRPMRTFSRGFVYFDAEVIPSPLHGNSGDTCMSACIFPCLGDWRWCGCSRLFVTVVGRIELLNFGVDVIRLLLALA